MIFVFVDRCSRGRERDCQNMMMHQRIFVTCDDIGFDIGRTLLVYGVIILQIQQIPRDSAKGRMRRMITQFCVLRITELNVVKVAVSNRGRNGAFHVWKPQNKTVSFFCHGVFQ